MFTQYFDEGLPARMTQNNSEFLLPIVTETDDSCAKTTSKTRACIVCGGEPARGIHFGVVACAACVAFFRRTVAENRTYVCTTERNNCSIVHGFTQRKNCRHCRYKKCLAMGMLPQKVQNKRRTTSNGFELLPRFVNAVEIDISVNEYAYKYSILQQQRMKKYSFDLNEAATMGNYLKIVQVDPELVSNYLNSSGALRAFADVDKYSLLKNYTLASRLVDQGRLTALYGGTRRNRFHLIDGSYIGATEADLTRFYGSSTSQTEPPMLLDPKCLARISLTNALHHVNEVVPSLERLDLSDEEFTALLNLVLWDVAIPELTLAGLEIVRRKRQKTIEDLCEYYKSTRMDIQIRLANLILLLSSIQKDISLWKEMLTIMKLMKADMPSVQVETQLCSYDDF